VSVCVHVCVSVRAHVCVCAYVYMCVCIVENFHLLVGTVMCECLSSCGCMRVNFARIACMHFPPESPITLSLRGACNRKKRIRAAFEKTRGSAELKCRIVRGDGRPVRQLKCRILRGIVATCSNLQSPHQPVID